MHATAIIVKPKELSNEKARVIFGDTLVKLEHADYYQEEDDVVLFDDGKSVLPLKEFKVVFKSQLDNILELNPEDKYFFNLVPMFTIVKDDYVDTPFYPTGFFEFYDLPDYRRSLVNMYTEAYRVAVFNEMNKLDEDDYEVILMDYHN